MKKTITIVVLLFLNPFFGQKKDYLEGKLGKSTIYLTIEDYEDSVEGYYFYQNSLKNIPLKGTRKKNTFELVYKALSNDTTFEQFQLTRLNNGHFKGFWINEKGKKINLELTPIDFSKYPKLPTDSSDQLERIKASFISFKQDSISKYKENEFIWYSEKHCKSPFFRLGNSFSDQTKLLINPILQQIHLDNTVAQLSCSSQLEYNTGEGIEYSVSITFLDKNLLGFEVFSSWFCGGAHPDFGGNGFLIDLNNGKSYEIDEIIAFDESATTESKGGFDAFSKYRTNYFAPKLYDLINENEHFVKPEENSEDLCDYTDLDSWNFVSWSYTEKGIVFTPYFYRVARSCESPFLVSFEKLGKYKHKSFPYLLN